MQMVIDVRRDTITLPTEEMKQEAFQAALGDSIYGEDPEHVALEQEAAEKMGKERALFVPSGTMGNLIAVLAQTERGDEIILEEHAHIRTSETAGVACVGGVLIRPIQGDDGVPEPEQVEASIKKPDIHHPQPALICLESTHYRYGGIVPPLEKMAAVQEIAKKHALPVHIDGARIFHSALYLGVDVREITRYCDTVMVSLSKALGAPVGAILCGPEKTIEKANRYRKMVGGGMRQIGWLCSCGRKALSDENIEMLQADHDHARKVARGVNELETFSVDLERVQSNFVIVSIEDPDLDAATVVEALRKKDILVSAAGKRGLRFVFSRQVDGEMTETILETMQKLWA